MPVYVMQRSGGTRGAETGRSYSFSEGDEIEAPKGEMSGLPGSAYETRDMTAAEDGPRYEVRQSGSWHVVYDTVEDEKVEGESERDEDAAQANADRLNS